MATGPMNQVLECLRRVARHHERRGMTDGRLLQRFLKRRDGEAFAELVGRHGPMVLSICERILRSAHDAEDAFQATFLVLARKAASVVPGEMVGSWLYGVAQRTALKARTTAARRRRAERQAGLAPAREARPAHVPADLQSLLAEELRRLPDRYGAPLALCLLEGMTRKEAARRLGWAEGTLSGRLARAKALLAARLTRRGLSLAGGVLALPLAGACASASAPGPLVDATVKAAFSVITEPRAVGAASAQVIALTEEVLKAMLLTKLKVAMVVVLAVGAAIGGGALACYPRATAQGEPAPAPGAKAQEKGLPPRQAPAAQPLYLIAPPDILRVEYSGGPPALKEVLVGEHRVRPDGTVGLAAYDAVSVAGLTPEQARQAIARKLRETFPGFDDGALTVDVLAYNTKVRYVAAYNSKVCYVIAEDDHGGEQVFRLPLTGNDTVLDALSQSGLAPKARGSRIWVSRLHQGKGEEEKVLPVDWAAITQRGAAATNYQLLPGDRIYVRADPARTTRDTRDSLLRGSEEEQAEKDFRAAEFYRRTGRPAAADFYYEMVRRRYPGTTEAARAEERLRGLRKDQRPPEAMPGAPAKVGRILIVGNVRTPDEVLLWAFPLSPGDEFREADLQEGEHALNRLARGVAAPSKRFRATVELGKPYRSGEVTDIVISVEE